MRDEHIVTLEGHVSAAFFLKMRRLYDILKIYKYKLVRQTSYKLVVYCHNSQHCDL